MRYFESYSFVTRRSGWFLNLFLCGLCVMIPVIGPIVIAGYLFEVFDAVRRDRSHHDYPLFTFNRFTPYLTRGIWPFIVQLITQFIVTIPLMFMYFLALATTMALSNRGGGAGIVIVIAWIMYMLAALLLGILSAIVMWPMILYCGVRQKLEPGPMLTFTKDFAKRNWKELLLSTLFIMFTAMVIGTLGYLALCVGFLFAAGWIMLAQHHLLAQMYELHESRGGIPVEGKPLLNVEIVTPDDQFNEED